MVKSHQNDHYGEKKKVKNGQYNKINLKKTIKNEQKRYTIFFLIRQKQKKGQFGQQLSKRSKTVNNGQKLSKIVNNGPTQSKKIKNGQK